MKRLLIGFALIISAFIFHWWVAIIASILISFYYDNLYEMIVVGLIIDVLYGAKYELWGFSLIFTTVMIACFYIIRNFKKQIFI